MSLPYEPKEGELIWTDFDPRVGREQSGRRPAVVLSDAAFSAATGFAIVCPITRRIRPFSSSVVLPAGLPVTGEILTSHIRSIDILNRPIRPIGAFVPPEAMTELRAKLAVLVGIDKS